MLGRIGCRVSRSGATWLLATLRLRATRFARDVRLGLRKHPVASTIVPHPPRPRSRTTRLELTHVLVASDLNAVYLECWPLARRAWREVARLEPLLVVVAAENEVPAE